jgi:PAS domain S-box-containing protein
MLTSINDFFKLPDFEDDDAQKKFVIQRILVAISFVILPGIIIIELIRAERSPRNPLIVFAFLVICIISLYFTIRGRQRLSASILVGLSWGVITFNAFTGFGVQGESYLLMYPLLIMLAGFLLGRRSMFTITILCLTSGLLMVFGAGMNLVKHYEGREPVSLWIASTAVFPLIAMLQFLSSNLIERTLKRAKQSEAKYKTISTVSTNYVFESRIDKNNRGETIWLAGAFERMTGFTPEEYIDSGGWYAHIHPEDLEKDAEDMHKLINNQEVLGSEIRTFTKNGEIRWERIFAHPVWDVDNNQLIGIVGAVQDVTEKKEAERRIQETLSQQSAILNNIPDMAWLKDLDGRYIAVNHEYLRVCGKLKKDVIGKTDFEIWEWAFAEYYRNDDLKVIKTGRRITIEEKQMDGIGRVYWVETTKTPIYNQNGNVIGTTGIARNITARKNEELERERLIADLGAKNAELERFTYTVSHDLKAPLVTINGFLGYIEKDTQTGDTQNLIRDLGRIRQAVDKMHNLLNDLLELSRIGRMINEPVEVEFTAIAADAIAMLEGRITSTNAMIEISNDRVQIFGDRLRLTEVLQNLVENALKFIGEQPEPKIKIGSGHDSEGKSFFFVQDNGIGIDPQYQDRIFGLFNKLDSNTEGTGIGLAIVKRIVEYHNGRIWLESEPGKGSTFYFTLPTVK